jgi:hypothetical protein
MVAEKGRTHGSPSPKTVQSKIFESLSKLNCNYVKAGRISENLLVTITRLLKPHFAYQNRMISLSANEV